MFRVRQFQPVVVFIFVVLIGGTAVSGEKFAEFMDSPEIEAELISVAKKAFGNPATVPGLEASDIRRSFKVKSKERGYDYSAGKPTVNAEVSVLEDWQAIIEVEGERTITRLIPDEGKFIENPEWGKNDAGKFHMPLYYWMEKEGKHYNDDKLYVEEIKTGKTRRMRLRAQGEYVVFINIIPDTKTVTFYQNNMAVLGLKKGGKCNPSEFSGMEEAWIKKMKNIAPLPEGAELEGLTCGKFNPYHGEKPYPVAGLRCKHPVSMGDYVLYYINPLNGMLILYNRKWEKIEDIPL